MIEITREQWAKIHRDYKGTLSDGTKCVFAGSLPKGLTNETGTTLVAVRVTRATKEG